MANTTTISKAQAVRDYFQKHPKAKTQEVVKALAEQDIEVKANYVRTVKSHKKKPKRKRKPTAKGPAGKRPYLGRPYPQKTLQDALQIPQLIKDKNHGNPWATKDLADALGYTNLRTLAFILLTRSAQDFGLAIGTHTAEEIEIADLGRDVVYPESPQQEREAKIKAFFRVDIFEKVYKHYGGSSFPERKYLSGTLEKNFGLKPDLHDEFVRLFKANCKYLGIQEGLEKTGFQPEHPPEAEGEVRVVGKAEGKFERTAFVIMPFSEKGATGRSKGFFNELLETLITPAANDAGFSVKTAEQKGSDIIQSTIIEKLLQADLVIADLTDHNPNVLFELGIRIARDLPVALISAEGTDRVFDVDNMMRVLHYNSNLWTTTVKTDLPRLRDHIKAAWDNRETYPSYMRILTRTGSIPGTQY